jgi:predicted metal-dependent hydrolase
VDYVVVHELAHLLHPGHTRAYWAIVGRVMPDYEARKEALRRLGATLVW